MRGQVLPLMGSDRLNRMKYLGKLIEINQLDKFVTKFLDSGAPAPAMCPDIYYLLKDYNGGKNPTASDPATRWKKPFSNFLNITCDCIGGMAWCGGFDRYQPIRFSHIYDGWINTDSMRQDAAGPAKCFRRLDKPEPGCFVVYDSAAVSYKIGHIGGVIEVPGSYDPKERDWWKALKVVDVASRTPHPANAVGTGLTWYNKDAWFIVPTMQP